MIPVWIGVVLHFAGLILGFVYHAIATRNRRLSPMPEVPKSAQRVVDTTMRDT